MGHIYVNACIEGTKGKVELKSIMIDTGATYTILPKSLLEEVGALNSPFTIDLELGNGRKVKAEVYMAFIRIGDRGGPAIIATFEGAKHVLGIQTLESLGLKADPLKGMLEPTRPKGIAYFYKYS